ncbi:hypothetical protein [Caldithrix abyssi]|uniref:hypothetical protein n=1 Tax=Caldithrix abyssi TaxID=187145 RepID=UPI00145EF64C|nr:hypothetical protein [Caldithrix abyssi]
MVQPSLPGRDWRLGLYIFPAVETTGYFESSLRDWFFVLVYFLPLMKRRAIVGCLSGT